MPENRIRVNLKNPNKRRKFSSKKEVFKKSEGNIPDNLEMCLNICVEKDSSIKSTFEALEYICQKLKISPS